MNILKKLNVSQLSKEQMASIKGGFIIEVFCGTGPNIYCTGSSCTGTDTRGCSCSDAYGNVEDQKDCPSV